VKAGILPPDCTPHDLRRTARSWWSNLEHGQSRDVMERLLGHAVGGKVERIYDRSLHLPAQRKVADAWGEWLSQLVDMPGR
jgi:integrase